MPGVYSLSTTVGLTFIPTKLDLKKSTKKQLNFSGPIFCSVWKTEQLFSIFFFTYHSKKYFIKAFYCLLSRYVKKAFYYLLLLVATYHTQKYFIKVLYYLAKT